MRNRENRNTGGSVINLSLVALQQAHAAAIVRLHLIVKCLRAEQQTAEYMVSVARALEAAFRSVGLKAVSNVGQLTEREQVDDCYLRLMMATLAEIVNITWTAENYPDNAAALTRQFKEFAVIRLIRTGGGTPRESANDQNYGNQSA